MRDRCARSWKKRARPRPFASRPTPMPTCRGSRRRIFWKPRSVDHAQDCAGDRSMIPVYSAWLSAHGKLWYDDKWYRLAWIVWPQALAVVVVLWFWAMPSTGRNAPWARPVDAPARASQLAALRDAAKTSRPAMDTLERDALGGEMVAQFFI